MFAMSVSLVFKLDAFNNFDERSDSFLELLSDPVSRQVKILEDPRIMYWLVSDNFI